eukprot:2751719-Amphidinium_carterae.1
MWWACADASFAPTGEASQKGVALVQGGSSQLQKAGNLVHWKSTRHSLISKSSCEAELLALVSEAELVEIMGLYSAECNGCPN